MDNKSAYIVGSGLAALTAACYLVRDGQMKGDRVHILEKDSIPGGACDGYKFENVGYVMRGGREMDNHFEVMWDLFHSIPSIETEGVSVLDEYYWLNKEDPNYSLCRATENRGQDAHTDGKFDISDKGAMEIMKLFFTPNEDLQDKRITDFFDDEVFNSNFWLYWRTMFAFENWHSALEMKLYIQRYIHHIGGLPDFKALRFTKYNQYESMILPMIKYLESFGVQFHYGVQVVNVEFDCSDPAHKLAKRIDILRDGKEDAIDLTENDLVFITNGGCVENSSMRQPERARRLQHRDQTRRRLGHVAQDRRAGSVLRPSRQVLLRPRADQLDERHRRDPRPEDHPLYQEHLQARSVHRPGRHRRHRHRQGFELAHELDHQPSAAVPRAAQGPLPRLGLLAVHRQARRLYQEAHARMHRQGDLHGVALPHRRARGSDRGAGRRTAPTPSPS